MIAGEPSLLRLVENAVVDLHRRWYRVDGRAWSEPVAYRWLHYEDPDPVARLAEGLQRLTDRGVEADAGLVNLAVAAARALGYPA